MQSRQQPVYIITMPQVTVCLTSLEYSSVENDLNFEACIFYQTNDNPAYLTFRGVMRNLKAMS